MTTWWCEHAWIDGTVQEAVRITGTDRITAVATGSPEPDDVRFHGLVIPGMANAHSHAFHRALRGLTHQGDGSFWTWREQMYAVAERLDPDTYLALARATYAEMALAGITCVGEFHYLHHGPGGVPYDDPNTMGHVLQQAAGEAGIRITLLDACYLQADVSGSPLEGVQRRFGDGDVDAWAARVAQLRPEEHVRTGVAAHSIRAVPRRAIDTIAAWDGPRHVHLSEQPAENAASHASYGLSPAEVLAAQGFWDEAATAVHATHLSDVDVRLLGGSGVCLCPTTERDLADGLGHSLALRDAGARLSLGSDQHAVIDLLEEARGVEMHARLGGLTRGNHLPGELLGMAFEGHRSLGWDDAGRLAVGCRTDLVAVSLSSPRTAGIRPEAVVFAATAGDVTDVVVDGQVVVRDGQHVLGDVARLLTRAVHLTFSEPF